MTDPIDLLERRIAAALTYLGEHAWHCEDCLVVDLRDILLGES